MARKQNSDAPIRIRDMIDRARRQADRPNHAPTVAGIIVNGMREEIVSNPLIHYYLLMNGALPAVERYFKRRGEASDEASEARVQTEQLSMEWPEQARPIIEQIDRASLYIPSVDEYVPLQPGITKPELREAATHLRAHGEDTLRIANLVDRLADVLDD
jgi:hypothetical protein